MSDAIQSPNTKDLLKIRGAREHNLKNIDLDIPRNKLVVISGLSGSGKAPLPLTLFLQRGNVAMSKVFLPMHVNFSDVWISPIWTSSRAFSCNLNRAKNNA